MKRREKNRAEKSDGTIPGAGCCVGLVPVLGCLLVLLIAAAGCTPAGQTGRLRELAVPGPSLATPRDRALAPQEAERGAAPGREETGLESGPRFQSLQAIRGETGEPILRDKKYSFSSSQMVQVAFDEMPLPDFVHHVFGDILKVNYVMHDKITSLQKTVTLSLQEQVSEERLFQLVQEILSQEGIYIFWEDDVFYIWLGDGAKDLAVGFGRTVRDLPDTVGTVLQVIPLKYLQVRQLRMVLSTIYKGNFLEYGQDNILAVSGPRALIEQVLQVVDLLDIPPLGSRHISLLRLGYWTPAEFIAKVAKVLGQEGIPVAANPGEHGVFFVELERTSSLLVFAAEKMWLDRLQYWAGIIDVPAAGETEQFFIFRPQNAKATELADSLQSIFGGGSPAGSSRAEREDRTGQAPGAPAAKPAGKLEGQAGFIEAPAGAPSSLPSTGKTSPAGAGAKTLTASLGEHTFRATVDENRNLLVIYAAPRVFEQVKGLLNQLDIVPAQVVIEVTVAEVTLTDKLQYGVEWFLQHDHGSNGDKQVWKTLDQLGLGNSGGLVYSAVLDNQNIEILMRALAQENLIKVLSSPRLTVRDGKSATFNVGNEVPVLISETRPTDVAEGERPFVQQTIEYRATGIILQVTPTVNARGVVTLTINQNVSEASTNDKSTINSPIILNRSIQTEVVAGDGQTVVLGGHISEKRSETVSKVPYLGDIPLLGEVFKSTSNSLDRTELVILITPRILSSLDQFEEIRESLMRSFTLFNPSPN